MPKPSIAVPPRYNIPQHKLRNKFLSLAFPAILLLLISLAGTLWYFVFRKPAVELDRVKTLLKKVEIGNFEYFDSDEEKFVKRLLCNFDDGFEDSFPKWNNNATELVKLCKLGNKLLQYYLIHNDCRYLDVATQIILTIDSDLLSKISYQSNDTNFDLYRMCIYVARFFVIYQVAADDENDENEVIKKTMKVCHNFIMKLIPMLNRIKVWDFSKSPQLSIYSSIPRLLSAYLYRSHTYECDVKSEDMNSFKNNLKMWIPAKGRNLLNDYNFYYGVCCAFDFWKE
ncbi:GSCOCT00014155001.2-RA-CDS [Cotesia congregata]|uniref:Cc_odve66_4 n=1 Tax=Cotesia congregata TaxID=51543 RepID=A0A8J2MB70_COTCN|nr:GSCOCT00014155001.2-RA-CDS [Cotesia congregata]CAG5081109.1 Cc_odve66_4 [Cotesia congregata]